MIPLAAFAGTAALGGGVTYDAAVVAWAAAVVTAGGTVSTTQKGYVNTLVGSLKSGGVWTLLDRCFLFAAENSQQATIDIVNLGTATNHGATFTANQGWAGNGTTTYLDSGFVINAGTNFLRDNCHFSEWRRTIVDLGNANASGILDAGAANGTYLETTTNGQAVLNSALSGVAYANASQIGHYGANRTSSSAVQVFLNGAAGATGSVSSTAPVALSWWIGGRNFNGSINQPHGGQILALTFGASLTSGQWTSLYNALNAYKTSVGA